LRYPCIATICGSVLFGVTLGACAAYGEEREAMLRGLAVEVGRVLGAASACPGIARPRIGAITNRITAVIRASAAEGDETAALFELLNSSQAEGSRSVTAKQMDCGAIERQLGDLEHISTTGVQPGGQAKPVAFAAQAAGSALRGITANEIFFGMSAPLTGPSRNLGLQMQMGVETAFNAVNDEGGLYGRALRIAVADDADEPARVTENMKELFEGVRVFGFVGNVGTPAALVSAPFALERRMLFFGALTGADFLRKDPPDRYVFNYRASYAEETAALVNYLVKVRKIKTDQIAVLAQQDATGDAGFNGVMSAMRVLRGGDGGYVLRLNYPRNTVDVDNAVGQLKLYRAPIRAVVMISTYRAAAKFIEKTHDQYPGLIYANISFAGSTSLRDELMLLGPQYAAGVVVSQVVPSLDGYSSLVLQYKSALDRYFPGEPPDYTSFEGYVEAQVLIEALKRAGPQVDTEKLVDMFENMRGFDLGLGAQINFGKSEHQGMHKVWGTQINESGKFEPIDLQ
jgi:branched-chain amino acid transport system substrate-binding protein